MAKRRGLRRQDGPGARNSDVESASQPAESFPRLEEIRLGPGLAKVRTSNLLTSKNRSASKPDAVDAAISYQDRELQ